jgi:steroid delta-isomerase-like uncharacterized protein
MSNQNRRMVVGRIAVAFMISIAAMVAVAAFAATAPAGGVEANKAAMLKVYEIMNSGNTQNLDQYIAGDFVEHQIIPGFPAGLEGLRQLITTMRAAFPDLQVKVDDTIASGDRVVCRTTMTGTQKGAWMGAPPSGKSFSMQAIDIVRFQNGKGVEHWGNEDDLGMMQQLGMNPADMAGAPPEKK